jgi:uncharacterized RDD family membrane protein YckC
MREAVLYDAGDHLGVMRRLLIDVVDTTVAIVLAVILSVLASLITVWGPLIAWTGVWIAYFVLLKGSRFRTLGYVMAGARIVNFQGQRPSYLQLLGRVAFTVLGPVNFVVDLCWISIDPSRQALRDKFAHTFVIRKNAMPAGVGRIVYPTYMMFGWTLMFAEVQTSP